jgi:MoaA/NifB/PqqE/SkfB family radical SAM enzyme
MENSKWCDDKRRLNRIKDQIRRTSVIAHGRQSNGAFALPLPEKIGLQLTNVCNLQCKTCYQWSTYGHIRSTFKKPLYLSPKIIDSILKSTVSCNSILYLWGGEPLLYSDWDELSLILENDKRWTVLCTNGLLIEDKIDYLLRFSQNLVILISVDGLEAEHDRMRGSGTFKRILSNIQLLIKLQKSGLYKGLISVNCVINESSVGCLYEYMKFFDDLGIDTVHFNYPWYISEKRAEMMDHFVMDHLDFICTFAINSSWHSYKYRLSESFSTILFEQLQKLKANKWRSGIHFQPDLQTPELLQFLTDSDISMPDQPCYSLCCRVEVFADGTVSSCKFFPEITVGNVYDEPIIDIWRHGLFNDFRSLLSKQPMPVCSKCVLHYSEGR